MLETITPETIARAQGGDPTVIGDLYEHYRLGVYRYLYYRVGDSQVAEDLTSEVFLRMMRSIPGYRIQTVAFDAWLFQIARNLAIDHHRKSSRRVHLSLEEDMFADRKDEPDRDLDHSLTSELLLKALEKLSEVQRDVIVLRFITGLPVTQVAQALHKSENAVKALQHRALVALRETLIEWEVSYA